MNGVAFSCAILRHRGDAKVESFLRGSEFVGHFVTFLGVLTQRRPVCIGSGLP